MGLRREIHTKHAITPRLEQLRWFLATIRYGSTREASKRLGVLNNSVIPNSNRSIQKELGIKLLNQNGTTTPAGEEFVKHAKRILATHSRMLKAMAKQKDVEAYRPIVTLHAEVWMLDKFQVSICADKYKIQKIVGHNNCMELYQELPKLHRNALFLITNPIAVGFHESKFKVEIISSYKLNLYKNPSQDPNSRLPVLTMDCFGPADLWMEPTILQEANLYDISVDNPVAMRNAILGGAGIGYLPEEWADGLEQIFPKEKSVKAPIWLFSTVQ
jgi:hypothetical protein